MRATKNQTYYCASASFLRNLFELIDEFERLSRAEFIGVDASKLFYQRMRQYPRGSRTISRKKRNHTTAHYRNEENDYEYSAVTGTSREATIAHINRPVHLCIGGSQQ